MSSIKYFSNTYFGITKYEIRIDIFKNGITAFIELFMDIPKKVLPYCAEEHILALWCNIGIDLCNW